MKAYQTFVGRVFIVLPRTRWHASRNGTRCTLEPGEYLISEYTGKTYKIQRDGIEYETDAITLFDKGYILEHLSAD